MSSVVGCARQPQTIRSVRNVVLVTIDTLRADHVGAYGYPRAHTPTIDAIANGGVLFEHAYSAAPITLTSHATMMTGRYPPGHGARDNGVRVSDTVPTLASTLKASGFATAAFVAAFPLDHQFGLNRGFDLYSDRMPRGPDGKLLNERPASQVVDEALRYLESRTPNPESRRFVWIHLFEPHAPYGDPSSGGSAIDRYDAEIATADRELGRLLPSINRTDTAIVVAADHGEAFGEHGEYAHSIFVYDTTLRVPLVINAPGLSARHVMNRVTLADLAPTIARLAGATMTDVDGIDLGPALTGGSLPARELYAESFAPLLEFGWAPLRSIRSGNWKFIAAPTPELFDIDRDAGEDRNVASQETQVAQQLGQRVGRYASASLTANGAAPDAADRLRALGYSSRSQQPAASNRPDPKDRREIAARIAQVTAGELTGDALMSALKTILSADQTNSQAHLRLGYGYVAKNDCAHAIPEFAAAANAGLPSADAHLGLATCYGRQGDLAAADRALKEAQRREPDNPVISANIGILQASRGEFADAIRSLTAALAKDPDLHEARFNLAIVYAKAGRRADAAAAARELLARLPSNAPQRPEVERLLQSVQ
ncbi:MAG TPA: sulfatase-like hydrolase/transferase [Vicinamibacterales bacterium]|nr:sulfatase-like hydrolase/transferase [Vicinamibacterales bacterium]